MQQAVRGTGRPRRRRPQLHPPDLVRRVRAGRPWRHHRLTLIRVAQTGAAAGGAFAVAHQFAGGDGGQAVFASIVAINALGVSLANRPRRTVEATVGIAVGLGVGTALIAEIHPGAWQITLVVVLALLISLWPASGTVLVQQLAVNAAVVAAVPASSSLVAVRTVDALIGGAVALAVNAVLFPFNPTHLARRAAEQVLDHLARAVETLSDALWDRDELEVANALAQYHLAADRVAVYSETLDISTDVARLTPMWIVARRRGGPALMQYREALPPLRQAVRDAEGIFSRSQDAIRTGARTPPGLSAALEKLVAALRTLHDELRRGGRRTAARDQLLDVIARMPHTPTSHVSTEIVVSQVRSTVIDLLEITGIRPRDAAEMAQRASMDRRPEV